jgi:cell wall-associated NlpC family hydrolase
MGLMARGVVLGIILFLLPVVGYAAEVQFKEGDQSSEVASMQVKLKEKGYHITVTNGKYTAETAKAVRGFQSSQKLKADGIVDNKTYFILMGKNIAGKAASVNNKAKQITDTAQKFIGVPYKFGGETPKAFDCSGFVQYVFNKNSISLPRTADVQYKAGKAISQNNLQQGDLVFFTTYEPGASHCGIFLEKGKFIHASSHGVMVSGLDDSYWKTRYLGARRVINA